MLNFTMKALRFALSQLIRVVQSSQKLALIDQNLNPTGLLSRLILLPIIAMYLNPEKVKVCLFYPKILGSLQFISPSNAMLFHSTFLFQNSLHDHTF